MNLKILEKCPEGGEPFDPYLVPDDWARLKYGRMLWKRPGSRQRLLNHWEDARHPYSQRFQNRYRAIVETVLTAAPEDDAKLDLQLRAQGHSLRTIVREIPPVFGDFY